MIKFLSIVLLFTCLISQSVIANSYDKEEKEAFSKWIE